MKINAVVKVRQLGRDVEHPGIDHKCLTFNTTSHFAKGGIASQDENPQAESKTNW